eukprot:Nk52_evm1s168 gene=Nk52_evmTU1s168
MTDSRAFRECVRVLCRGAGAESSSISANSSSPIGSSSLALSQSRPRLVVMTGAGCSAESGINTFRDPEMGVWRNRFHLLYYGTPLGWKLTPNWAWAAYVAFRRPIQQARPNPGHDAIAGLQRVFGEDFPVITQNVDGLHQRAGSQNVIELHGSVHRHRCIKHGHSIPNILPEYFPPPDYQGSLKAPKCPHEHCSSHARPDCILFSEALPTRPWSRALAAIHPPHGESSSPPTATVVLVIGTSMSVYPAAALPEEACQMENSHVFEINPTPTAGLAGKCDGCIVGTAADILPAILEKVLQAYHLSA